MMEYLSRASHATSPEMHDTKRLRIKYKMTFTSYSFYSFQASKKSPIFLIENAEGKVLWSEIEDVTDDVYRRSHLRPCSSYGMQRFSY